MSDDWAAQMAKEAMADDLDVWLIKVELDPITGDFAGEPAYGERSREYVTAMIQGFVNGGAPITPINGGVRITMPNGYWDCVLKESLDHNFRWKGMTSE